MPMHIISEFHFPKTQHVRCNVIDSGLKFTGIVTQILPANVYFDQERLTVTIEGGEPLYAELRIPNTHKWILGQRLTITILAAESKEVSGASAVA